MAASLMRTFKNKMEELSQISMPQSSQLSCDNIAISFDQSFNVGGGCTIKKFLFDSIETVIAEIFELVLFAKGESGRTVMGLLGRGVIVGQLTFNVTDILHYFNINFIYLPAFHTKSIYPPHHSNHKLWSLKEGHFFDFIAQLFPSRIIIIYHMKVIVILAVIAVAFAQFGLPDFGKIGETIKNGVVEAEQKVEHLAKEEIHNAEELINKGIDKISEAVNPPSAPAPAPVVIPVPVPQPAEKEVPVQPKPAIITEPVVVAPLPPQPAPAPQAEIKVEAQEKPVEKPIEKPVQKQDQKPEEKPLEKPVEEKAVEKKEVPTPTENLAKEEEKVIQKPHKKHKEGKRGHSPKHKPRKEESSSESSQADIEQKRERHPKKERKERREYTSEEIQRWREERERRMRKKQEHMKKYEQRNRNIERNENDSRKEWKRIHDVKMQHNEQISKKINNAELERIKEVVKLAVLP